MYISILFCFHYAKILFGEKNDIELEGGISMKKQMKRIVAGAVALAVAATTVLSAPGEAFAASKRPAGMSKVGKNKLSIVTWNSGMDAKVEAFKEMYPQYADRIEVIQIGVSATDPDYVAAVDKLAKEEKRADIVCWDIDMLSVGMNKSYTVPMSKIGFQKKWYKNAYKYTVTNGSKNGKLTALTDQVNPGCFIYNKKLAKKAFGTSTPSKVQAKISNWNKFLAAAKQAAKKNVKIVQGADDVYNAFRGSNTKTYAKNGKFQLPEKFKTYCKVRNTLKKNDYTNNTWQWDEDWMAGMKTPNAVGYFGSPWFFLTMQAYGTGDLSQWAVVAGPSAYEWGGTYYTATKYCDNKGLAQLFLYTLTCDTDFQYKDSTKNLGNGIPNNMKAVKKMIKNKVYKKEFKLSNDPCAAFDKAARKLKGRTRTKYDKDIEDCLSDEKYDFLTYEKTQLPSYKNVCKSLTEAIQEKTKLN